MDRDKVLALYDREMRRDPPGFPGVRVERLDGLVRIVGDVNLVTYCEAEAPQIPRLVAEQVEYFRRAGTRVEWTTFAHDRLPGLESALEANGFRPEELESLVVFDLSTGLPRSDPPPGLELRRVADESGWQDAMAASASAFGPDHRPHVSRWADYRVDPALFVAYLEGTPVASGRTDLPPGRSFAGLYGGGVNPSFRHRGVYRALVRRRAELALAEGYRYLTVDARETSRPILERLGFVPLTTTRPWVLRLGPGE